MRIGRYTPAYNNSAERMRITDKAENRTARQSEVLADAILGDKFADVLNNYSSSPFYSILSQRL